MAGDLILAIDNGTQSERALLFDPRGTLLAKSRVSIESYFSDSPRLVEQNPEIFWNAICQTCHEPWSNPGIWRDSIAAIGVGLKPYLETVIAEVTRLGDLFVPNPSLHGIYEGLYQLVCWRMYCHLRPLYEEIRELTGNPSH